MSGGPCRGEVPEPLVRSTPFVLSGVAMSALGDSIDRGIREHDDIPQSLPSSSRL